MSVTIGSARSDENRAAYGGKAGDQTGREVSTQDWYLHDKGWYVYRPYDCHIAARIADAMEAACKNPHIGYDQHQRHTLYQAAEPFGFDPGAVIKNCETDCSALVRVCLAYAGIMVPAGFRTGNMGDYLSKTGAFITLRDERYCKSSGELLRGDILVTRTSGHTVVVLSNGSKAGTKPGFQDRALRMGCKGSDVLHLQKCLIALGYRLPKYGADGDFGAETLAAVNAFKADRGLKVDGIFGKKAKELITEALA